MSDLVITSYIGLLGRAPEHSGYIFWSDRLAILKTELGQWAAADRLVVEMAAAAQENGELAATAEETDQQYIIDLYVNLIGRQPEGAGMAFWTGLLDSGMSRETLFNAFVNAITDADAESAFLANRTAVAIEFARFENSNDTILDSLLVNSRQILDGVTADPTTVAPALQHLANPPAGEQPTEPTTPHVPGPPPVPSLPFIVHIDDWKNISFGGTATDPIVINIVDGTMSFSRGEHTSDIHYSVLQTGVPNFVLAASQTLQITPANASQLAGAGMAGEGTLVFGEPVSVQGYFDYVNYFDFRQWNGNFSYDLADTAANLFAARDSIVVAADSVLVTEGGLIQAYVGLSVEEAEEFLNDIQIFLAGVDMADDIIVEHRFVLSDTLMAMLDAPDLVEAAYGLHLTDTGKADLGVLSVEALTAMFIELIPFLSHPKLDNIEEFPGVSFGVEDTIEAILSGPEGIETAREFRLTSVELTLDDNVGSIEDVSSTISDALALIAMSDRAGEKLVTNIEVHDTLSHLMADDEILPYVSGYRVTTFDVDLGVTTAAGFSEEVAAAKAIMADALNAGEVALTLGADIQDSYDNLVALNPGDLAINGVRYTIEGPLTLDFGDLSVESASRMMDFVLGATNGESIAMFGGLFYTITDSLQNFYGASNAVLERSSFLTVQDQSVDFGTVSVAQLSQAETKLELIAFKAGGMLPAVTKTYELEDTLDNLMSLSAEELGDVEMYRVTGPLSVLTMAQAEVVMDAANASLHFPLDIRDEIANFVGERGDLAAHRVTADVHGVVDLMGQVLDSDVDELVIHDNAELALDTHAFHDIALLNSIGSGTSLYLFGEGTVDLSRVKGNFSFVDLDANDGSLVIVPGTAPSDINIRPGAGSVTIKYMAPEQFGDSVKGFSVMTTVIDLSELVTGQLMEWHATDPGDIGPIEAGQVRILTTAAESDTTAIDPYLAAAYIRTYAGQAFDDESLAPGDEAYFVVKGFHSAAVYKYTDDADHKNDLDESELTLVVLIDAPGVGADNFLVSDMA